MGSCYSKTAGSLAGVDSVGLETLEAASAAGCCAKSGRSRFEKMNWLDCQKKGECGRHRRKDHPELDEWKAAARKNELAAGLRLAPTTAG